MQLFTPILLLLVSIGTSLLAQISSFPYIENFDSAAVPSLPAGWTTTTNRNISGDFTTSTTSARSSPNCLSSTNGKIYQSFVSPVVNFSGMIVDSLFFYERRTSTHRSGCLVEASIDGDTAFALPLSDTLIFENSTLYIKRSVALPQLLNGKSSVRFRWRVLADSTSGSTGVIRFDDISVTVKKAVDLGIHTLTYVPLHPQKGNTLSLSVEIMNKALAGNFSFAIQLFDSLDFVASKTESVFLLPNEIITVQLQYPAIRAGRHPLGIHLMLVGDEDTSNNSSSVVVNAGYYHREALVNEIMYAPSDGKEWIEIVNNSIDSIDLSDWKISDRSSSVLLISDQYILPPQGFVLLAKDTSFKDNFPDFSGSLIRVSSLPTFNNDSDAVVIIDQTGRTIDSVTYQAPWGGSNGRSLERIDTAVASTTQSNWKTSVNVLGATPGIINSVTKKNFDAAVSSISFTPLHPVVGDNVTVNAVVKNIGVQKMTNLTAYFYVDENKNALFELSELKDSKSIVSIVANDSAAVSIVVRSLSQGNHIVGIIISSPSDLELSNDTLRAVLSVGLIPKSIVINEVMYAPDGDMPEWVECYNASSASIDIKGWKISDATASRSILASSSVLIPPHSYYIIADDSTFTNYYPTSTPVIIAPFPALNNSSPDAVVLYDERGAAMDSVYYKPSWGGTNGNSLQRFDYTSSSVDSANWKSALPSPGNENSIARKDYDIDVKNISTIKNGNAVLIWATILNYGRLSANSVVIRFFHDANNDSIPQPNELLSASDISTIQPLDSTIVSFSWNISLSGSQTIIVLAEFLLDERLSNNSRIAAVKNSFPLHSLIINEIMYEPKTSNAEFVELFNPGNDSINVFGWKLMDTPSSSGSRGIVSLSNKSHFIPPQEFFLVASDSSVITLFPLLQKEYLCINSSLSLSNSGEDIVLIDLTDALIDSVWYSPSWHLKNITTTGRSLERISPAGPTNDIRNWSSSVAPFGSTPLQKNSIFTIASPSSKSISLSPNPFSPDNDGFEDFLTINYTIPAQSSRLRVRIFDAAGRLIRRLAVDELTPSHGSVIWNGLNDNGVKVRIGMYIVLLEALDNFGGVIHAMKDVAVVAKKM